MRKGPCWHRCDVRFSRIWRAENGGRSTLAKQRREMPPTWTAMFCRPTRCVKEKPAVVGSGGRWPRKPLIFGEYRTRLTNCVVAGAGSGGQGGQAKGQLKDKGQRKKEVRWCRRGRRRRMQATLWVNRKSPGDCGLAHDSSETLGKTEEN